MIDHGFAFNGPNWDFPRFAAAGPLCRAAWSTTACGRWTISSRGSTGAHFPEEVIDLAWKRIPPDWIAGEEDELERMLERLYRAPRSAFPS